MPLQIKWLKIELKEQYKLSVIGNTELVYAECSRNKV